MTSEWCVLEPMNPTKWPKMILSCEVLCLDMWFFMARPMRSGSGLLLPSIFIQRHLWPITVHTKKKKVVSMPSRNVRGMRLFLVDVSPWKYCRFRTNTGQDHKFHGRCSQANCVASKDVLSNFTVFSNHRISMLHACNTDPQNLSGCFIVLDVLVQSSHPSHHPLHPTSPSRGLRQALRVEQWEQWVP